MQKPKMMMRRPSTHWTVAWAWWMTCCLLWLRATPCRGFQYRKDTLEDCSTFSVEECASSSTLWYQCPIWCGKLLELEGSMAEVDKDPEAFFDIQVKAKNGRTRSLEDYEGYVTVYAVVPTSSEGMAKFYYDMLEHIATVYPYTVQFLLLPWKTTESSNSDETLAPQRYDPPRVLVLEDFPASAPSSRLPEALEYLLEAKIVAGNAQQTNLMDDRVTLFLISADGMFVERLVSPSITVLERRIAVYLQQLSLNPEL